MNFVTRVLTSMVVQYQEVPRPAQAASPSSTTPDGQQGRLVCVPWEGLYVEDAG